MSLFSGYFTLFFTVFRTFWPLPCCIWLSMTPSGMENTRNDQIWDPPPRSGRFRGFTYPPSRISFPGYTPMGDQSGTPHLEPSGALVLVRCRVRPYPGPGPRNRDQKRTRNRTRNRTRIRHVRNVRNVRNVQECQKSSEMFRNVKYYIKYRKVPYSVKPYHLPMYPVLRPCGPYGGCLFYQ